MTKQNYKVIYIHQGKTKEFQSMELGGFEAEVECLHWCALNLDGPVRVVRVERIELWE